MTKLFNVIEVFKNFISSLTLMDALFLGAMLILIVLMIILIYYIKVNQNNNEVPSILAKDEEIEIFDKNVEEQINNEVVKSINNDYNDEEGELLDLESLTKFIKEKEVDNSSYNAYEKEQEEKAIISYDELLKRANKNVVEYLEDKDNDIIRKIDIDKVCDPNQTNDNLTKQSNVTLVSYEQEEAFLEALKKLQNQLLN